MNLSNHPQWPFDKLGANGEGDYARIIERLRPPDRSKPKSTERESVGLLYERLLAWEGQ